MYMPTHRMALGHKIAVRVLRATPPPTPVTDFPGEMALKNAKNVGGQNLAKTSSPLKRVRPALPATSAPVSPFHTVKSNQTVWAKPEREDEISSKFRKLSVT